MQMRHWLFRTLNYVDAPSSTADCYAHCGRALMSRKNLAHRCNNCIQKDLQKF